MDVSEHIVRFETVQELAAFLAAQSKEWGGERRCLELLEALEEKDPFFLGQLWGRNEVAASYQNLMEAHNKRWGQKG